MTRAVVFLWQLSITLLIASLPLIASADNSASINYIESLEKSQTGNAKKRLTAWKKLILNNKQLSEVKKLSLVNDFFNQFQFRSDISFIGQPDYWMTPGEFAIKGGGDCEDFSIAKYFTLLALGVSMDKMRITYVKALELNQAHMVLAYYETPDAEPVILDNLTAKIKKASERPDLKPVYSFNGDGLWLNKLNQSNKVGSSSRLKKWRTMLERMRKKGN